MASPYERFRRSMDIGYEEWHDGIGYDLDALAEANPEDRAAIEALLVPRAGNDWRDVEALAAIGSPAADRALLEAFRTAGPDIRVAILRDARHVVPADRLVPEVVRLVDECDLGSGMTHVLTLVEDVHPPEVVDALLRGTLDQERSVPVHYAAMLLYLHGQSSEPFDWEVRPFVLQFTGTGPEERLLAYRELCHRIGR